MRFDTKTWLLLIRVFNSWAVPQDFEREVFEAQIDLEPSMSDFELSDDEDEITENNSNELDIETPTNSVSTDQGLLP